LFSALKRLSVKEHLFFCHSRESGNPESVDARFKHAGMT